ncbi:MAG: FeoB-associated Cys-rich membrane protein [Oscillospiraceae bacterium]|nr:FeoB-associated Cys-rich membrane protein [Oscillospiraceae bacterium]
MLDWLSANIGTIIITLVLIAIVAAIIFVIRRDKKNGKSACGGNCGHCPMGTSCHHGL